MNKRITYFALCALLLFLGSPVWGADIYVDNASTGCSNPDSDYTPAIRTCGAGSSTVYSTINAAIDVMVAGDKIIIRGGTTYTETNGFAGTAILIARDLSGTTSSGARVTIQNYSGDTVTIKPSTCQYRLLADYDAVDYVTIDGTNGTMHGIVLDADNCDVGTQPSEGASAIVHFGGNWIVKGVEIKNFPYNAISSTTSNNTYQNLKIHDSKNQPPAWSQGIYSQGQNHLIENNEIYNIQTPERGAGNIALCPSGTQADECNGTIVRNNKLYDSYMGIGLWQTQNAKVYNNQIYRMWGPGIRMHSSATTSSIFSNTITEINSSPPPGAASQPTQDKSCFWSYGSNANVYKNNLAYLCADEAFYLDGADGGNTWENNLGDATDSDAHLAIVANPLFTNAAVGDFTLQATSPAKNAGADLGSPYNVDYLGISRPQGAGWDIGAFESISSPAIAIGWWQFNEVAGSTANDSGTGGNAGTITGAAFTHGKQGAALSFDGNDYITLTNTFLLTSTATYTAWIKPTTAGSGTWRAIMGSGVNDIAIFITDANKILAVNVTSTATITHDIFTHLAVTWDGTNTKIYFNGVLDSTTATSSLMDVAVIGTDKISVVDEGFLGVIDEVQVYNYALSGTEIARLASIPSYGTINDTCETTAQYPTATVLSTTDSWKTAIESASANAIFLMNAGNYITANMNPAATGLLIKPNNCAFVRWETEWRVSGDEDSLTLAGMVIDGKDNSAGIISTGDNADFITLRNMNINGGNLAAIRMVHPNSNFVCRGCVLDNYDGGTGSTNPATYFGAASNNLTIEDSWLQTHVNEDSLGINGWGSNVIIQRNRFEGKTLGNWIDIKNPVNASSSILFARNGLYPRGLTSSAHLLLHGENPNPNWPTGALCVVEHNYFRVDFRGIRTGEANGENGGPCFFRRNVYHGLDPAVELLRVVYQNASNSILNETFYNGLVQIDTESSANILRNSAFHTVTYSMAAADITTCSHNINYNGTGTFPTNCTSTQTTDPGFISADDGWFTLTSLSSVAIGNGTDVGIAYNGATPSIGAHDPPRFNSGEVGAVDAVTTILTFSNNVAPPLLPATGCTGFSRQEENPPSTWNTLTISSCERQGTNQIKLVHATATTGRAQRFSYVAGNVKDSQLIGNYFSNPLHGLSNQGITNNIGGSPTWTLTQSNCRAYRVPLVSGALDVYTALNTRGKVVKGGSVVVVCQIDGENDPPSLAVKWQADLNGANWANIPDGSGAIHFTGTSNFSGSQYPQDGFTLSSCLAGGLTNMAGSLQRTSAAVPTFDLTNHCIPLGGMFTFDSTVTPHDVYRLRLVQQDGTPLAGSVYQELEIMDYAADVGY